MPVQVYYKLDNETFDSISFDEGDDVVEQGSGSIRITRVSVDDPNPVLVGSVAAGSWAYYKIGPGQAQEI